MTVYGSFGGNDSILVKNQRDSSSTYGKTAIPIAQLALQCWVRWGKYDRHVFSKRRVYGRSSDDMSHPDRIHKQAFLGKHSHIGLVGTNIAEFRTNNPKVKYVPKWIQYCFEKIKAKYEKVSSGASFGTLLLRGSIFDDVGGLIRNLP
ncbi:hypothetical protein [Bacillus solitudinis]|nr:hypothetical protein [Bacillus solitudinis]